MQFKGFGMLGTIVTALLVLWLLGAATAYTFGGFMNALLVLALVTIVIRFIRDRRITS
jgi:hypothetical protein